MAFTVLFVLLQLVAYLIFAGALEIPTEVSQVTGLDSSRLLRLSDLADVLEKRQSNCSLESIAGGVLKGPALPTPSDILKRNSFVKREGTRLTLLSETFRMVGGNIYWLGLDENVVPDPSYPAKSRVLEVFATIAAMKGNTVRGHTLGISVGNALSVEPTLDVFNDAAWESIDFAILAARIYGIKLLIPLVDNYNYYHGGKYIFIGWHGIPFNGTGANITPPDVGAFFFNNTDIVNSFKRYITNHLNHVNQFTGIALKDDPTILGWESGNELSAIRFGDGPAPAAWTKEIGELVKSLAPNQLFMDGTYGIYPDTDQLKTEVVDIFGDHFYPANISRLQTGLKEVNGVGKNFFAGEYDWTALNGGDDIATFLSTIEKTGTVGDTFWSLFGHDNECCQWVEHDDGESFYYLRENGTDLYINQGKMMIEHAGQMTSQRVPTVLPAVACPQSVFPSELLPAGLSEDCSKGLCTIQM